MGLVVFVVVQRQEKVEVHRDGLIGSGHTQDVNVLRPTTNFFFSWVLILCIKYFSILSYLFSINKILFS